MFITLTSRNSGNKYSVGKINSRWVCTCKHFVYRLSKRGGTCKHIDEAIILLADIEQNAECIDMTIPKIEVYRQIGIIKRDVEQS